MSRLFTSASELVAIALAHALALFAAVSASINVSGGHVNPAVTFGTLLGGRISVVRAIYYWIAQLLGSIVAALLLRLVTNMRPVGFYVSHGVGEWHGVILEIVMTFGLVYTVYATAIDPKRGSLGTIAPLAIGLIVGANILVGGPFDGASMNPARAFGPALVGWRWDNHGVILEIVMTFGLVYTVYATAIDPKRGSLGTIAPLAIGLIVGANILVGGPFDGASMNPARAFGPALVGWRWDNHWIYWVGPLIGGALAGLIYEYMVIPTDVPHHTHQPLAPEDY
ncbi:hypothetical protein CMV_001200 [Castanea mollissima]|uniref:Uncharacterized protein n=1 Tax=Castanea mollissima TaxID=60419 RepID=A0A8J4RLA4_9ROSI|nr:hypothetical protein CMV_001200 [Castanea mollissima]